VLAAAFIVGGRAIGVAGSLAAGFSLAARHGARCPVYAASTPCKTPDDQWSRPRRLCKRCLQTKTQGPPSMGDPWGGLLQYQPEARLWREQPAHRNGSAMSGRGLQVLVCMWRGEGNTHMVGDTTPMAVCCACALLVAPLVTNCHTAHVVRCSERC